MTSNSSGSIQIQFMDHVVEVPDGFEELTLTALRCKILIVGIGLEPADNEFYIAFDNPHDCERFADLVIACSDKELIDRLFGNNKCLTGNFSIDMADAEDDRRITTIMEVCLPISVRDDLTKSLQRASKLIEADVSYCESNARRSNGTLSHEDAVPKSEWDGHIFSYVSGVDNLAPGDLVKIQLHAEKPIHLMERLWIRVTAVDDDDDEVTGVVNVHPASLTNLHHGDVIHFRKHQIMRVAPPRNPATTRNVVLN